MKETLLGKLEQKGKAKETRKAMLGERKMDKGQTKEKGERRKE
jgi:hypothetical protein